MARSRGLTLVLAVALLGQAFCVPADRFRLRRGYADNELDSRETGVSADLVPEGSDNKPIVRDSASINIDSKEDESATVPFETSTTKVEFASPVFEDSDSDEDDDDFEPMNTAPSTGGGSNIFSLLRLVTALFPNSSGGGGNPFITNLIRGVINNQLNQFNPDILNSAVFLRRNDVADNLVDIDDIQGLKPPPLQRQETEEDSSGDSESSQEYESDENIAAEESVENNDKGNGNDIGNDDSKPAQESNGKGSDEDDYSDEPPEGDGQGGGILGILAGLSGGEDGQSDLGSLLATISGIVANLSGDGFDLNALIASGIGLFVGLLSEGEQNPGAVIASYLLTSLDTITGGGSQNNGAFFGTFLSKLIRGTSAQAKTPSSQPASPVWTLKMDILRAFLQFGTSLLGMASSSSSGAST